MPSAVGDISNVPVGLCHRCRQHCSSMSVFVVLRSVCLSAISPVCLSVSGVRSLMLLQCRLLACSFLLCFFSDFSPNFSDFSPSVFRCFFCKFAVNKTLKVMQYEVSDGRSFCRVAAHSPFAACRAAGFAPVRLFFVSYPAGKEVWHYYVQGGTAQVSCSR